MQEYHAIGLDIEKYLQDRLRSFDPNHSEFTDHYNQIKGLFKSGSFSKILPHIEAGLTKFSDISKFNPEYANYLLALKKHFVCEDKEDEEKRLKKLFDAIESDDPQEHVGRVIILYYCKWDLS